MAEEDASRESLGSPEGGTAHQEEQEEEHRGETEAHKPKGEQIQEEVLPDRQEGAGTSQKIFSGKHKKGSEREQREGEREERFSETK